MANVGDESQKTVLKSTYFLFLLRSHVKVEAASEKSSLNHSYKSSVFSKLCSNSLGDFVRPEVS